MLIEVDGQSTDRLSHGQVVNLLWQGRDSVTVTVVSWPGTLL